ncbi:NAD(P)-dependent oxidoreductase [Corynebacterium halotolerans]|uniref:NAD(P)-binding domain-containing protein n=1 Tax=Corynebacterium halotolerans YIM 70093 = DSM 44683 TaxID=1121362 RepID=M1P856_9CORY|nr:NAD(P)H-binding protein [Corynebacterium halotolerans]AGF72851.1 hypothetical protein A605_09245 [Corynebacterium halotolerans YIM 70093 = DSM 44683]
MATITVIGATGMIGSAIAAEAAARGHHVIGVSRSGAPSEAAGAIEGVKYRTGDFSDTDAVVELAGESDVLVVSTASGRTTGDWEPVRTAHRGLIAARPGVRLFIVGGAGGLHTGDGTRLIDAGVIPEEYAEEPRTFAQVLDDYLAAPEDLDWVMLAPSPVIEPGEKADSYRLSDDTPAGERVTTGTFAAAALDEIETPAHHRARFTVADA